MASTTPPSPLSTASSALVILRQFFIPALIYLNHSLSPLDAWIWDGEVHFNQSKTISAATWTWLGTMLLFNIGACYRSQPDSAVSTATSPGNTATATVTTSSPRRPILSHMIFSPIPLPAVLLMLQLAQCLYTCGLIHHRFVFLPCALTAGCANALLLESVHGQPARLFQPSGRIQKTFVPSTDPYVTMMQILALLAKALTLLHAHNHGASINPFVMMERVWWMLGIHALCGTFLNHYAPRFFPLVVLHLATAVKDGVRVPLKCVVERKATSWLRDQPAGPNAAVGGGGARAAGAQAGTVAPAVGDPGAGTQPVQPRDGSNQNNNNDNNTPTDTKTRSRIDLHIVNATGLEFLVFGFSNMMWHILTDDTEKAREVRKLAPMLMAAGLQVIPP